jgi:MFS family permease
VNAAARKVQRTYLLLLLLSTLAASFIWGINTLFLLDAHLNNTEAFAANAFFTGGRMLFEVPTGIVADTRGRRVSYLLGALTLTLSTALYLWLWYVAAPFWSWALASMLLGLGFTFFSGAFEAWLFDALTFTGYFRENGKLETVLARGAVVEGAAMLSGSIAGGVIAQATNLGVPYAIRALLLVLTLAVASVAMHDLGFSPRPGKQPFVEARQLFGTSIALGFGNAKIRWVVLAGPFTGGVGLYGFYAMQPYLLQLLGNQRAYGLAGLTAAIVAGAQIAGGLLAPHLGRVFGRRTSAILAATQVSTLALAVIGMSARLWVVIVSLIVWALAFAVVRPVRQAYLNGLITSEQRATVLSFDSLLDSSGGVVIQPVLGRAADAWGYPTSYALAAVLEALAMPFLWLARRERAESDPMGAEGDAAD